MTTATKANVAAIAGALVVISNWLLTLIPGWDSIPNEPRGAIAFLVSAGIAWGMVYFAPPNRTIAS